MPATVKAANLGRWFPPWTVFRDKWREALRSSVSGVSTDALLFSQRGVPLVHRYRVLSRAGTHISLRVNYMIKLRAFTEQADAESRVSHNRDQVRSMPLGWIRIFSAVFTDGSQRIYLHDVNLAGRCPLVQQHHQVPARIRCLSRRRRPARACMVRELLSIRSIYNCRGLLTRTSSRRCFSQCGSPRRSIRLHRLNWPLNLCALIWMLCRPGTRRRAQAVLLLLAQWLYPIRSSPSYLYILVTPIRIRRRRVAYMTLGANQCHQFRLTSMVPGLRHIIRPQLNLWNCRLYLRC